MKLSTLTDEQLLRRCARYTRFMTRWPRGVKTGSRRWKEWAARAMLAAEREAAVRVELLKRHP